MHRLLPPWKALQTTAQILEIRRLRSRQFNLHSALRMKLMDTIRLSSRVRLWYPTSREVVSGSGTRLKAQIPVVTQQMPNPTNRLVVSLLTLSLPVASLTNLILQRTQAVWRRSQRDRKGLAFHRRRL